MKADPQTDENPIAAFARQIEEEYARQCGISDLCRGPSPVKPEPGPVMSIGEWRNNAELIADVARLGYLDGLVLDATYGKGRFWKKWNPLMGGGNFVSNDLYTEAMYHFDFRGLPWGDNLFDSVVLDPPYKLNGTPSGQMDDDYGVGEKASRQARMNLITDGLIECLRVLKPKGYLLVKCQDMVSGGKVRWQTDEITSTVTLFGHEKVDSFHLRSYRPQPAGTTQKHARRNFSTLLVFRKAAS